MRTSIEADDDAKPKLLPCVIDEVGTWSEWGAFKCAQQCESKSNQWYRTRNCRLPPCEGLNREFRPNCPQKYQKKCEKCLDTSHYGRNYVGKATTDQDGLQCLSWSNHRLGYQFSYPNDNKCRNLHLNGPVIACLVKNLKKQVVLSPCDVKVCKNDDHDVYSFHDLLKGGF